MKTKSNMKINNLLSLMNCSHHCRLFNFCAVFHNNLYRQCNAHHWNEKRKSSNNFNDKRWNLFSFSGITIKFCCSWSWWALASSFLLFRFSNSVCCSWSHQHLQQFALFTFLYAFIHFIEYLKLNGFWSKLRANSTKIFQCDKKI